MQMSKESNLQPIEPRTATALKRSRQGIRDFAEIYLDANATVRPLNSVVEAVADAMRNAWGNPSSEHCSGMDARRVLGRARDAVSRLLIGVDPDNVVLTSGGTESCNSVLTGANGDATIVVSSVEHPASSVPAELAARRGAKLVVVPVSADGLVDPEAFRRAALEATTLKLYVSIQWANGETGVIQPVADVARAVYDSRPDAVLHVDAAQAVGRIPTAVPDKRGIMAFSFSGHKLHGPQGTGVLAFSGRTGHIPSEALIVGGGQQRNRRSGTQNVAGAAGLAVALEERATRFKYAVESMRSLRDEFEARLCDLVPHLTVNGGNALRTPNTSNILFRGVDGMSLVSRLDALGIRCSQGSACSSGSPKPSHVLRAMGLDEQDAYSSVRFSFSILNTAEEVERTTRIIGCLVKESERRPVVRANAPEKTTRFLLGAS